MSTALQPKKTSLLLFVFPFPDHQALTLIFKLSHVLVCCTRVSGINPTLSVCSMQYGQEINLISGSSMLNLSKEKWVHY